MGVKLGEHVVLLRMIFFFLQLISIFCSIIYVKLLFFFLTAEFHGIWESLVYETGVKTQVK